MSAPLTGQTGQFFAGGTATPTWDWMRTGHATPPMRDRTTGNSRSGVYWQSMFVIIALLILAVLLAMSGLVISLLLRLLLFSLRRACSYDHSSTVSCPECGELHLFRPPATWRYLTWLQLLLTPVVVSGGLLLLFLISLGYPFTWNSPAGFILQLYGVASGGRLLALRSHSRAQARCDCKPYSRST